MSRVNQMVRFYVNYLTSVTSRLLPEEETLGLSILRLCLDADQPQSLAKGQPFFCDDQGPWSHKLIPFEIAENFDILVG